MRPGAFELGLLFSPEAAAAHIPDAFRPTLVVFDMLSLRLLELRTTAHHALSIALHLGVCALLERVLARFEVEPKARLADLTENGPNARAFSFRHPFPPPGGDAVDPVLDECA